VQIRPATVTAPQAPLQHRDSLRGCTEAGGLKYYDGRSKSGRLIIGVTRPAVEVGEDSDARHPWTDADRCHSSNRLCVDGRAAQARNNGTTCRSQCLAQRSQQTCRANGEPLGLYINDIASDVEPHPPGIQVNILQVAQQSPKVSLCSVLTASYQKFRASLRGIVAGGQSRHSLSCPVGAGGP
jgi:hypothetical protein